MNDIWILFELWTLGFNDRIEWIIKEMFPCQLIVVVVAAFKSISTTINELIQLYIIIFATLDRYFPITSSFQLNRNIFMNDNGRNCMCCWDYAMRNELDESYLALSYKAIEYEYFQTCCAYLNMCLFILPPCELVVPYLYLIPVYLK